MPDNTSPYKKFKFYIWILALAVTFELPAAASGGDRTHPAENVVWENRLYREIEFLSSSHCEGRATGTMGATLAAFWIMNAMEDSGLMPLDSTYAKHIYAGQGLIGRNLIGMLPGSKKSPRDRYIIVGTHYDHLGILKDKLYPGADENASGVAAVLNLARMFSTMKTMGSSYSCNIIFVFFDGRQMGLAGSQSLWNMIENSELHDPLTGLAITKEKIELMVNIEQIGSSLAPLASGRKDYMIMLGNHSLSRTRQAALNLCNSFYDINLDLSYDYYGSADFTDIFYRISDQRVFIENKIPSVVFTSGITMNTNRTYDSVHTLNMEVLKKRIHLIFHWLEKML